MVPSIGKTESVAASSCKEVRDVLSNECSGGPQSGAYWITVTDPCTQHNRTMRVGQKHTCLGEILIELQELIVELSVKDIQHNTDEVFSHI